MCVYIQHSAPQQASFFCTYILLLGLSRTPLELLRLPALLLFLLRSRLADSRQAAARAAARAAAQPLGQALPQHALVLLLGLVFSVASPLIAPVTLLYFASASACQVWMCVYLYDMCIHVCMYVCYGYAGIDVYICA